MHVIRWSRYPNVAANDAAKRWLQSVADLGLASNTVEAYGRGVEAFLTFSRAVKVVPDQARRDHIAAFVRFVSLRKPDAAGNGALPAANATIQQRLTAIRLFYDFLVQEQCVQVNPVGRGYYTAGRTFGGMRHKGLVPRWRKLPWIPKEEEWKAFLEALKSGTLRQRLMLCLAYDAALRREELCSLRTEDFDPSRRLLSIRAETTKTRNARIVPYSSVSGNLFHQYLIERRKLCLSRGPLFLSTSNRNSAQPLSIWTWSKEIKALARESGVAGFSTHTFRHLRLTDLARAGWDIHEIAKLAGHRSIQTTLLYVHLSGVELAEKIAKTVAELTSTRLALLSGGGGR
jgi:integrase/recombinase XerD